MAEIEKGYFPDKATQLEIKQGVEEVKRDINDISVKIENKNVGKVLKSKTFTENGIFTVPAGVTEVYITGGGAGGGGGASQGGSSIAGAGGAGGITSFGSLLSLNGGAGGIGSPGNLIDALGGVAGGPGGQPGQGPYNNHGTGSFGAGNGGNSGPYHGGYGAAAPSQASKNGGYCSGGGAAVAANSTTSVAGGGGGGDFVYDRKVTVTPLTDLPVTIGTGGSGFNAAGYVGGKGGNGILTVKWWE